MILIKSISLSFTIWVLTALLNGILCGTWLAFFSNEVNPGPIIYLVVIICTLVFSIPGIFIFWIVLLVNWREEILFRSLLQTGFIISALSSLLLYILPGYMINGQQFFLSLGTVIASIASIMIHHAGITSVSSNKIFKKHA